MECLPTLALYHNSMIAEVGFRAEVTSYNLQERTEQHNPRI